MKIEQRNKTEVDRWEVEELLDSINSGELKKVKIRIPSFQRRLRWRAKQKEKFIDSLKKGYPIGSLLIYEKETIKINEKEIKKCLLVDGLQRTNALKEYYSNPTKFFKYEDISNEFADEVVKNIQELSDKKLDPKDVKNNILKWLHDVKGLEEKDEFGGLFLAFNLNEAYKLSLESNKIKELGKTMIPFIDEIKDRADVSKLKVPILIFKGDINNLPEIYRRINRQGTQLDKYEIFAAVWEEKGEIEVKNKEIRDRIKEWYDSLIFKGFEIEGYEQDVAKFHNSKFNYFEYILGMGKLLTKMDKYKYLFSNSKSTDEVESLGFNLVTACLKGNVREMNEVPNELSKLDIAKFEQSLFGCIDDVINTLKGYIDLKANKKLTNDKPKIYHTEMHIVAIISKVFRTKFDNELKEKDDWKDKKKVLLENIRFYYLYDIINDDWRGSGDSEVARILKSPSRYDQLLYKQDWENKLQGWFEDQLKNLENDREKNIPNDKMLFLNYIYTHTHSNYRNINDVEEHIEHITPVNRLKSISPCPINCIGNLSLLEKNTNESKLDLTIFEYYNKIKDDLKDIDDISKSKKRIVKRHLKNHPELEKCVNKTDLDNFIEDNIKLAERDFFIDKSDLDFISKLDDNTTKIEDKSKLYTDFLRKRFNVLKEKFLTLNHIQERPESKSI